MGSTRTSVLTTRRLAAALLACALATVVFVFGTDGVGQADRGGKAESTIDFGNVTGAKERPSKGGRKKGGKRPNIVVIVTDDQAKSTVLPEAMPNLFGKLRPLGTTFTNFAVTTPLCCPSRAAYMTGSYGHNNGVLRNSYSDLREKKNVLPVWLKRAGYTTAHVGKFLNSYEQGKLGPRAVAPGWDLWFTQLEKRRYYNWDASKNGKRVRYGNDDDDHVTAVTTKFATRWAGKLAKERDPFFLQVDYYAPHGSTGRDRRCESGPVPEPRDERRFDDYPLPTPPNFNEADVSDKPESVRERPPLTIADRAVLERRYRCALEAVYGVDRGIGKIMRTLDRRKELDDTVFVFTSDNGLYYGEHRIVKGKPDPYEENVNMPLTVVVPPKFRDRADVVPASAAPVANIDLAPTLLELADGKPCRKRGVCRTMDGRSLMPLLNGEGGFPSSRAVGMEILGCRYSGVRDDRFVYIEHFEKENGACVRTESELYDLDADPHQLDNLLPALPVGPVAERLERMRELHDRVVSCEGIEGRDPAPSGAQHCP